MKIKVTDTVELSNSIIEEYMPNKSIFNKDRTTVDRLKHIIANHLTVNERSIFILYLECNNKFKLMAKILNTTDSTVLKNYIARVKQKIRNKYYELYNNTTAD